MSSSRWFLRMSRIILYMASGITSKLFTPHCSCICDNFPPRLLKNHDFTFSPILLPRHKKPIYPTWLSQNPTKINSFWNQTFHTSFCTHLWKFTTKIAQKPWLQIFTNFATKAKKANPPNLAYTKSNQDQCLLQPMFSDLILHTFVTITHQDFSKTMTPLFHQFCYHSTKTRPCDQTWLSQHPTKINSFCNQTFDTSFWMHLWQFPTKIAKKPWLHVFSNFATKEQKANPPNLAKAQPNKDQFLLEPNFSHLILHTFLTLPHQDCSETMTSLFHQFCYQGTKTRQATKHG